MLLVLLLVVATSLGRALAAPGGDPLSAKGAEWARGHGLGFVVTAGEELAYRLDPPKTGGSPDPSLLDAPPAPDPSTTTPAHPHHVLAARAPMPSVVTPALTGEGVFRTVVGTSRGPAVQLAYVRPDPVHTSYLAAVMVLDPRLVRFVQHPGSSEPGQLGRWRQPDDVPPAEQQGLVATFNSGFKLADAQGGWYADGNQVGALRRGAASVVITKDGRLDVGAWGSDDTMSSSVVSVRQNLRLLVDHGAVVPAAAADAQSTWGTTVKGADDVWRSGIGVDARGDVIEVVGPALSAQSLGEVLQHAGAVRAMELDINTVWVSTMWYSTVEGAPVPHKVLPFQRPADRYLGPTSRDFVAAYLR